LSADPVEPSPEIGARILRSASSVVPLKRSERIVSRQRFTAIAAVILLAALLVVVLILWQQNRSLRQQNEFAQLLIAPGSKVAQLSGTNEAKIATAKLAYAQNGRAILIADGLPRPPAGKEYQLWFIVNNKPLPGKTFAPDNRGHGQIHDQVPEAARNSAIFAITLEPAGGVSAPTGAIYLRGEL
jgi:anti-sigma-K factor RskA